MDALGSTRRLTDSSGVTTDEYSYDAWGNLVGHQQFSGSVNQPYQYVGQLGYYTHVQDANIDLLQLGVRLYDPETGRFTQRDPIGDTSNSYEYAATNPANMLDPWGLTAVPAAWRSKNRASGADPFLGFDDVWETVKSLLQALDEYASSTTPADAMLMGMCPELGAAKGALAKPRAIKIGPNLIEVLAQAEKSGEKIHRMHLLPQANEFGCYWQRAGLDIERYVIPLPETLHTRLPRGVHTNPAGNWNRQWKEFFKAKWNASKREILHQLYTMMRQAGLR